MSDYSMIQWNDSRAEEKCICNQCKAERTEDEDTEP